MCVNGSNVSTAFTYLKEHTTSNTTPPLVAAVVGFPLGASTTHIKVMEATEAVSLGAKEIDST